MNGITLYKFDSNEVAKQNGLTCYPVTGLAWRSTDSDAQTDFMRWNSSMNNKCEKITLNSEN